MDIAVGPKKSQAGKNTDESLEIAGFLDEGADPELISLIDLFPGHGA